MTFSVRFTTQAEADLLRSYEFIPGRDPDDPALEERALQAIRNAFRSLALSPFSYRKAGAGNPFLRELIISFGTHGYVVLFDIEDEKTVTVLAVRHQREDDFH